MNEWNCFVEWNETFMPAAAALSSLSSFCSLRMSWMNEREKSCGAAQENEWMNKEKTLVFDLWMVSLLAEDGQRQFIHQLKKIKVLFSLLIGMKMAKWAEWTKQIISLNFIQTTIEWNGEMNCLCEWSSGANNQQLSISFQPKKRNGVVWFFAEQHGQPPHLFKQINGVELICDWKDEWALFDFFDGM